MAKLLVLATAIACVGAMELSEANWDEATAGKTVFIKFLAPWWGHCKSLKPAWDQLIEEYANNPSALVADVDCTTDEGKGLCETHGVQGYPTIKWGSPSALEDYEGGREFDDLKAFAEENLKPLCSPTNLELCDDEKKKQIEDLLKMSDDDLTAEIEKKDAEAAEAGTFFDAEVAKLQETYEGLEKAKTEAQAAVKASGLSLMKAVKAARSKEEGGGEEL